MKAKIIVAQTHKNLKKLPLVQLQQDAQLHRANLAKLSERTNRYVQNVNILAETLKNNKLELNNSELKKLGLPYEKIKTKEKLNLRRVRLETWIKFEKMDSEFNKLSGGINNNKIAFDKVKINIDDKSKNELVEALEESLVTYSKQLQQLEKLEANFAKLDIPFDVMRKLDSHYKNIKLLSNAVDKLITTTTPEKDKQELNSIKQTLRSLEGSVTENYRKLQSSMEERDNWSGPFEKAACKENIKSAVNGGNQSHNQCAQHLNTILQKLDSMINKTAIDSVISKVKTDLHDNATQQPTKSEKKDKKKDKQPVVNLAQKAQHQVQAVIAESKEVITNVVGKKEPEYPKIYNKANELKTELNTLLFRNQAIIPSDALHAATALNVEINKAVDKYLKSIKTIDEAKNISVHQYQTACTSAKETLKQECSEAIKNNEDAIDIAPGFFNNLFAAINKFLKAIGSDWEITVEKTQFAGKQDLKERLVALKEEAGSTHNEIKSDLSGPK